MKYGCSWGNLDTRPTVEICKHDDNARILGVASVNFKENENTDPKIRKEEISNRKDLLKRAEVILRDKLTDSKTLRSVNDRNKGEFITGSPRRSYEIFKHFANSLKDHKYMKGSIDEVVFISYEDINRFETEVKHVNKPRAQRIRRSAQTPDARSAVRERDISNSPEDAAETQLDTIEDSPSPSDRNLKKRKSSPAPLSPPRRIGTKPMLPPQDTLLDSSDEEIREGTPDTVPASGSDFARVLESHRAAAGITSRPRHRLRRMQGHLGNSPRAFKSKPFPSPRSRHSGRRREASTHKDNAPTQEFVVIPDDESSLATTEHEDVSDHEVNAPPSPNATDIDPTSEDGSPSGKDPPPGLRGTVKRVTIRHDERKGKNNKSVVVHFKKPLDETQYHPGLDKHFKSKTKTGWMKPARGETQEMLRTMERMM